MRFLKKFLLVAGAAALAFFTITPAQAERVPTTAEGIATHLYRCVLDRKAIEEDGLRYYTWALAEGQKTVSATYLEFFESPEYVGKAETAQVFVTRLYNCILFRAPEQGAVDFWVSVLGNGATRRTVTEEFLSSDEFVNGILPALRRGVPTLTLFADNNGAWAGTLDLWVSFPGGSGTFQVPVPGTYEVSAGDYKIAYAGGGPDGATVYPSEQQTVSPQGNISFCFQFGSGDGCQINRNPDWFRFPRKSINYYPAYHPWDKMWVEWDEQEISRELGYARELGVELVETYIQFGVFADSAGRVNPLYLQRAERFVELADQKGLKVQFTLFDWVEDFSSDQWAAHTRFLQEFVPQNWGGALYSWGMRNEADLVVLTGKASKDDVHAWLKEMLTKLRDLDNNRPIELEIKDPASTEWLRDLTPLIDWWGWSMYGYEGDDAFVAGFNRFRGTGLPVALSEFGMPAPNAGSYEDQKKYYEGVLAHAKQANASARPWILMDFPTLSEKAGAEKWFGILSDAGFPKPAAEVFRNW
ncbi:DUF4214 domain-containing protein [Patescibacteria group bacterium]|nr:DUF4214 domain-containing protein [Patescibacteria group bacterium]